MGKGLWGLVLGSVLSASPLVAQSPLLDFRLDTLRIPLAVTETDNYRLVAFKMGDSSYEAGFCKTANSGREGKLASAVEYTANGDARIVLLSSKADVPDSLAYTGVMVVPAAKIKATSDTSDFLVERVIRTNEYLENVCSALKQQQP